MNTPAKIPVLIADDEPVARAGMRSMLSSIAWIELIGEASSGPEAVEAIDRLRPALVFLDIQMPGLLGTDVVRSVQHQPMVIFTTAWSQHAADAFELGAIDYLLKPFGVERLTRTLDRVRVSLGESHPVSAIDRCFESQHAGPITRIFVRSGRAILPIAVDQIAWFEADGDYVALHVGRARHLVHVALSRLESRLDPARFMRIHRNSIVGLDHVRAFRAIANGRFVAELQDGTELEVSRSKARELRALGE